MTFLSHTFLSKLHTSKKDTLGFRLHYIISLLLTSYLTYVPLRKVIFSNVFHGPRQPFWILQDSGLPSVSRKIVDLMLSKPWAQWYWCSQSLGSRSDLKRNIWRNVKGVIS